MYLGGTDSKIRARQATEKRIVLSTIDELLAQGFALSVDDGGDDETKPSTTRKEIIDAIMNTDDDHMYVWQAGKRFGWVHFVYGNDGWDVMSDYTTNLEPHMPATQALIDKLAA